MLATVTRVANCFLVEMISHASPGTTLLKRLSTEIDQPLRFTGSASSLIPPERYTIMCGYIVSSRLRDLDAIACVDVYGGGRSAWSHVICDHRARTDS